VRKTAVRTAVALCVLTAGAWAQTPVTAGRVVPYRADSPHPYPLGSAERPRVWSDRIVSPGATFVRVHFAEFNLAAGDYVTVANPAGSDFWTYSLRGPNGNGEFWSFAVTGDTAIITLHAGGRAEYGYRIDEIGPGIVPLNPPTEVLCGTEGREDVICHTDSVLDAAQKAVARLLYVSRGLQYLCTGWMVAGSQPNMMMTNNHCLSNQREVSTLEARFNYQHTTCGGSTIAPTTSYAGGTFLKTNNVRYLFGRNGLDYTLLTLQGNPEATWGEIVPTSKTVNVGDLIWFIQHPGGRPKEIGFWEDAAKTVRCKVNVVNASYSTAAPNSQTAYGCDSEGGSSGSPIVDPATGHAIALHHFGGVGTTTCLNSASAMDKICADAGSLLNCATN
jgi:lysyl endopeptidase